MRISRREFVESSAVSVAGWYLLGPSRLSRGDTCVAAEGECVLLDLRVDCGLRESLRGYQEALGTNPISVREMRNCWQGSLVVVPGMARMDTTLARMLLDLLEAGTNVLLESGAGFTSAGEFGVHRGMLRDGFEIEVQPAVDVWGRAGNAGWQFAPYVEYVWPCVAMVRDFSRVIPVAAAAGAEVIASARLLPVAAKKRVGKGMLVFLGSPLGPALLAGDLEARKWLRSLATTLV
jgi:hypothetical protein